jgi:hypothetical protein
MTGYKYYNAEAFDRAEDLLTNEGFGVLNPVKLDRSEAGFDCYKDSLDDMTPSQRNAWRRETLKRSIEAVTNADGVCTLDGWINSKGANAEIAAANVIGIPVKPLDVWLSGLEYVA